MMDLSSMDDVEIDDLINYPPDPDNECNNGELISSGESKTFPSMWDGTLQDANTLFLGSNGNLAFDFSSEISVPDEDIVQLEWLSTFMEDSFSGGGMTLAIDTIKKDEPIQNPFFTTSSPVSVLETTTTITTIATTGSSSSSGLNSAFPITPGDYFTQCATRTKRPHSFTSKIVGECENGKKKKKNNGTQQGMFRKCKHCGITKTPQWRTGPFGPKTLCNACGVRYKSGRLFPEYRPAASPTFVPSLHSNSHRKVTEMRNNKIVQDNSGGDLILDANSGDLIV